MVLWIIIKVNDFFFHLIFKFKPKKIPTLPTLYITVKLDWTRVSVLSTWRAVDGDSFVATSHRSVSQSGFLLSVIHNGGNLSRVGRTAPLSASRHQLLGLYNLLLNDKNNTLVTRTKSVNASQKTFPGEQQEFYNAFEFLISGYASYPKTGDGEKLVIIGLCIVSLKYCRKCISLWVNGKTVTLIEVSSAFSTKRVSLSVTTIATTLTTTTLVTVTTATQTYTFKMDTYKHRKRFRVCVTYSIYEGSRVVGWITDTDRNSRCRWFPRPCRCVDVLNGGNVG